MPTLDSIRTKIAKLYETNPNIHVNVNITKPKINLSYISAVIIDVYPNLFRIQETDGCSNKIYTVQYKDVLTNRVQIIELNSEAEIKKEKL